MADVTERLDHIEQALATTNEQVGEVRRELGEVKREVGEVKRELGEVKGEVGEVKRELGEVKGELGEVKGEIAGVKGQLAEVNGELFTVKQRLDKHDERFDSLESEVQKLRILEEANSDRISVIADVQSQHGEKLDEIVKTLVPLKDFVMRVVDDHEHRITELEKAGDANRGL